MDFKHKTKEQIDQERVSRLLPKGRYKAFISNVVERKSSNQQDMFEIKFDIVNPETKKQHQITNWITVDMMEKLYCLAFALDIMDRYESDRIVPFDIAEKWCDVEVTISPAKDGYAPTNNIVNYFPCEEAKTHYETF